MQNITHYCIFCLHHSFPTHNIVVMATKPNTGLKPSFYLKKKTKKVTFNLECLQYWITYINVDILWGLARQDWMTFCLLHEVASVGLQILRRNKSQVFKRNGTAWLSVYTAAFQQQRGKHLFHFPASGCCKIGWYVSCLQSHMFTAVSNTMKNK